LSLLRREPAWNFGRQIPVTGFCGHVENRVFPSLSFRIARGSDGAGERWATARERSAPAAKCSSTGWASSGVLEIGTHQIGFSPVNLSSLWSGRRPNATAN
jgi:hypothetical protein